MKGCKPGERFTYYDQEHTLGADIKQDDEAWAIVTADFTTDISTFLQAVARMRGLALAQQIIIDLAFGMKDVLKSLSLDSLFSFLSKNQQLKLEEDHFQSALKQIHNLFRENLRRRLIQVGTPKERDRLFTKSETFFIEFQTDDIIALYQARNKQIETSVILNAYANKYLTTWKAILMSEGDSEYTISEAEKNINTQLKIIIERAELNCSSKQIFSAFQFGKEVQKEQQKEMQKEKESQKHIELNQPNLILRHLDLSWINSLNDAGSMKVNISKLMKHFKQNWRFDENLYASANLLYTYINQDRHDIYNLYTKPCTAVLFQMDKRTRQINAMLVCAEEEEKLQSLLSSGRDFSMLYWLSTMSSNSFTSQPSLNDAEKKRVSDLLEQAAFFSGRVDLLASRPASTWMIEEADQKIQFLRKQMQPFLPISEAQLNRFENHLFKLDPYVEQWAKYPLNEALFENWIKSAPEGVKKRLTQLLIHLAGVRQAFLQADPVVSSKTEDLSIHDAVLFTSYVLAITLLDFLKKKNYKEAALFFTKNQKNISLGFLDYCLGSSSILLSEEETFKMLDNFQYEPDIQLAWIEQVLAASSIPLSFDSFSRFIHMVSDNKKLVLFFRKFISAKGRTEEDFKAVLKLTDRFDSSFIELALKKEDALCAVILLHSAKLDKHIFIQRAIADPDFCFIIKILMINQQINENLLLYLMGIEKVNIPLVKRCINFLYENHLIEKINLQDFFKDTSWTAFTMLEEAGIKNKPLLVLALSDFDFRVVIKILGKNGLLEEALLTHLLTNEKIIPKVRKRLDYLDRLQLLNEIGTRVVFVDDFWPTIELLEAANVTDKIAVKLVLTDANFRSVINYLKDLELINEVDIQAFIKNDLWPDSTVRALMERGINQAPLVKQVMENSNCIATVKILAKYNQLKESLLVKLLRHEQSELLRCLTYLETSGLVTEEAFQALEKADILAVLIILEEMKVSDVTLIKKALEDLELVKALNVLSRFKSNNVQLLDDVINDVEFRKKLAGKYIQEAAITAVSISDLTIAGIKAIHNVREDYAKKAEYTNAMSSINAFAKEACIVLLDNDGKDKATAQKQIQKDLSDLAKKHFKQKHLGRRILIDVLLALSVIGLLVFVGRKLSGRSFFFSTPKTNRQKDFEKPIVSIMAAKSA